MKNTFADIFFVIILGSVIFLSESFSTPYAWASSSTSELSRTAAVAMLLHTDLHIVEDWRLTKKHLISSPNEFGYRVVPNRLFLGVIPAARGSADTMNAVDPDTALNQAMQSLNGIENPKLIIVIHSHGLPNGTFYLNDLVKHEDLLKYINSTIAKYGLRNLTVNLVMGTCHSGSIIPFTQSFAQTGEMAFKLNIVTASHADLEYITTRLDNSFRQAERFISELTATQMNFCPGCSPFQKLGVLVSTFQFGADTPQFWSSHMPRVDIATAPIILRAITDFETFMKYRSKNEVSDLETERAVRFHLSQKTQLYEQSEDRLNDLLAVFEKRDEAMMIALLDLYQKWDQDARENRNSSISLSEILLGFDLVAGLDAAGVKYGSETEITKMIKPLLDRAKMYGIGNSRNAVVMPAKFAAIIGKVELPIIEGSYSAHYDQHTMMSANGDRQGLIAAYDRMKNYPQISSQSFNNLTYSIASALIRKTPPPGQTGPSYTAKELRIFAEAFGAGQIAIDTVEQRTFLLENFQNHTEEPYPKWMIQRFKFSELAYQCKRMERDLRQLTLDFAEGLERIGLESFRRDKMIEFFQFYYHGLHPEMDVFWDAINDGLRPLTLQTITELLAETYKANSNWPFKTDNGRADNMRYMVRALKHLDRDRLAYGPLEGIFRKIARDRSFPEDVREMARPSTFVPKTTLATKNSAFDICRKLLGTGRRELIL